MSLTLVWPSVMTHITPVEVEEVMLRLENMQRAMSDAGSSGDMSYAATLTHFADCLWDNVEVLRELVDRPVTEARIAA
ncbi:MAG: hypothetical protein AAF449_01690 [Myxococcota bacterium]